MTAKVEDRSRDTSSGEGDGSVHHVYVMAPDPQHWDALEAVAESSGDVRIHPVLEKDDVVHVESLDVRAVLAKAERELGDAGPVDAIIAQWDFPTTLLVPMLCHERGLRSPSLEAVIRCSHKYWSRVAQRESIPEYTPAFELVDPFEDGAADSVGLQNPFWLKPVKGFSSMLGFRIDERDDLEQALAVIREEVDRIGEPFDVLLEEAGVDAELRSVDGRQCIAEAYLSGIEVAHEGYVQDGEVHFHGTLEMVRDRECFTRLLWPAMVPAPVLERMADASTRFLKHIGYDDGCFNAEYFWNPDTDDLKLIEVNPRISQSHVPLAMLRDGMSNHQVAFDVGLGRRPTFQPGGGEAPLAAKFYERIPLQEGRVTRAPSPSELEAIRAGFPTATIVMAVEEGDELSELVDQDPRTSTLFELYLGADDERDLLERHARLLSSFPLEVDGVDATKRLIGNAPIRPGMARQSTSGLRPPTSSGQHD